MIPVGQTAFNMRVNRQKRIMNYRFLFGACKFIARIGKLSALIGGRLGKSTKLEIRFLRFYAGWTQALFDI